jgi:transposase InsO family protein
VLTTITIAMLMRPDLEDGADLRTDVPEAAPQSQATPGPTEEVHRQRLRRRRQTSRSQHRFPNRDASWQLPNREEEQAIRRDAAAFAEHKRLVAVPLTEIAGQLDVCERTLRQWRYDLRRTASESLVVWASAYAFGPPKHPRFLGRPHVRCTVAQAEDVERYLNAHSPWVGVPSLRTALPQVPRVELRDRLLRFRYQWSLSHPREIHVLSWLQAGTVWAMDFTKVRQLIDGRYQYVFTVRDLASGLQLSWQSVADQTAATVLDELELLFTIYGAPLVLKSDNGSAFLAECCQNFLRRWRVYPLYSPPGCPGYNGAVEASIGSLKRRTAFLAERNGHTEGWTSADLAEARTLVNEEARPSGRSPQETWDARRAPTEDDREAFAAQVHRLEEQARQDEAIALDAELNHYEQAALHRRVLQNALVERGFLSMTRRRITQRFYGQKAANIW